MALRDVRILSSMARLGYSWGETEAERVTQYPCDALIGDPHQSAYRAIDVAAPAPLVWRWLCQLRVAPYSYDWVDNWGRRSPQELTASLDDLEVGQNALSFFEIARFERDRSITLHAKKSVFGELAVSYCVVPTAEGRSRITVKLLARYSRRVAWLVRHVPPIGDLVMARKQLRTLKKLAERDHARTRGGQVSSAGT